MHLKSQNSFLTLHTELPSLERRVEIVSSLGDALKTWTPGTRVSPIWPVCEAEADGFATATTFKGKHFLFLAGPVPVAKFSAEINKNCTSKPRSIWTTVGCFNLIVQLKENERGKADIRKLRNWAKKTNTPYEVWSIENGRLKSESAGTFPTVTVQASLDKLYKLTLSSKLSFLSPAFQEYCVLMASSLNRSAHMMDHLYQDLMAVNDVMISILEETEKGNLNILDTQSRFLSMNAALSRFASQTFSGMPPITGTECHFWTHSLLGTGAANIALARLVTNILNTLGNAKLPERIELLKNNKSEVPSFQQLTNDVGLLSKDIIGNTPNPVPSESVTPLITYFSGRDGFSSHLQTLSAPLATIAECNSYRSSLFTVTHELSHIFVQGVLSYLYPNWDSPEEVKAAHQKLGPSYQASNWFDAAGQLLIEGLVSMEQAHKKKDIPMNAISDEYMAEILMNWRREAQEIMVHTFDFIYFYASDPEFYIKSIWHSWCAIPGIDQRVPEYVLRTLCAISALLLKETFPRRLGSAKNALKDALTDLNKKGELLSNYGTEALKVLNRFDDPAHANGFESAYSARLYLVRLVAIFLRSEKLGAQLFSDAHITGGSDTAYAKKKNEFDLRPIGNPLRFLREHLKTSPTESESLWVLHNLAFNVR